jgi:hypothetical protein
MVPAARSLKLRLLMAVDPSLVSVTRRFVEEALSRFVGDLSLISRVAMTAHELLENAAKYADDRNADLSLTVDGSAEDAAHVTLRLSNETSPGNLTRLREMFSELNDCADPMMFYVELMRRNALRASSSGIGLARIRAEGEMSLGLTVEGQTATIVAQTMVR